MFFGFISAQIKTLSFSREGRSIALCFNESEIKILVHPSSKTVSLFREIQVSLSTWPHSLCMHILLQSASSRFLLLFSKAKKVGKNAFIRLQPSSSFPFPTDLGKDGVRTPNDKHFPRSLTETEGLFFQVIKERTGNDFYFKVEICYHVIGSLSAAKHSINKRSLLREVKFYIFFEHP